MFDGAEVEDPCYGEFYFERQLSPTSTGSDSAMYFFQDDSARGIAAHIGAVFESTPVDQWMYALVDNADHGDFFEFEAWVFDPSQMETTSYILQFVDLAGLAITTTALPTVEEITQFVNHGRASLLVIQGASFAKCEIMGVESID